MTVAKNLFVVLLATAALAPGLAHADYTAIAFAGNGSGHPGYAKTQAEADWEALKNCNDRTPQKDCRVQVTKAVVRVVNPDKGFIGYTPSEEGVEAATAQALKACPSCKVDLAMTTPGFWTLAASKNRTGVREQWLTYGYANLTKVRADAVSGCEERTEYQCEVVWSGAVPGNVKQ